MKKTVEITIDTDTGDITVSAADQQEELAEMPGAPAMTGAAPVAGATPPEQDAPGQTYQSMDEALAAAAELLTGDTRETPETAMASAQKGYGSKPRMGMGMGRPSVGQVFGE